MKDAPTEEIRLKFALKQGKVGIAGVADAIQNVADGCWMFHNESLVYFDCNNTEFHVLYHDSFFLPMGDPACDRLMVSGEPSSLSAKS